VAPAKPPIPGSERPPTCSPRPPTNGTEVYSVINSTPAAPLSPDLSLCTPQPGTELKSIKSTGLSKNPPPCSSRPRTNEAEVDNVIQSTQAAPLTPLLPRIFWGVPGGGRGVCGGVRSANQLKVTRLKLFVYVRNKFPSIQTTPQSRYFVR
jgi:hypothetical protein